MKDFTFSIFILFLCISTVYSFIGPLVYANHQEKQKNKGRKGDFLVNTKREIAKLMHNLEDLSNDVDMLQRDQLASSKYVESAPEMRYRNDDYPIRQTSDFNPERRMNDARQYRDFRRMDDARQFKDIRPYWNERRQFDDRQLNKYEERRDYKPQYNRY